DRAVLLVELGVVAGALHRTLHGVADNGVADLGAVELVGRGRPYNDHHSCREQAAQDRPSALHDPTLAIRAGGRNPAGAQALAGRRRERRARPPAASSTASRPPWAARMRLTMARPRPEPSPLRRSARQKRWTTRLRSSGGTPGPRSLTCTAGSCVTSISTSVPVGVCWSAFS